MGTHWGTGRHMDTLSLEAMQMAMKSWYFGEIFYILTCTFLRLAVGFFLLRILTDKRQKAIVHALNAVNIVFNLYFFFITVFQCSPVTNFWVQLRQVNCINPVINVRSTYAQSAICAFIDWAFALLPVLFLWNLQMATQKKISLGFVLSLGAIASTAPLIRLPSVVTLATGIDFLWATTDVVIWSSVEPGLGLTAICLATLRPLFAKWMVVTGFSKSSESPRSYESAASQEQRNGTGRQQQGSYGNVDLEMTSSNRQYGNSSTAKPGDVSQISHSDKEADEDLV